MPQSPQALFEECVDRHADSLYRVAFRLMGDRDLAQELVQESFLQAWQNLAALRDPNRMRGWLFSILRNQYGKRMRTETRWQTLPPEQVGTLTNPPANSTGDLQSALQEALHQLEDHHKLPLLLVAMEGLSTAEAAEVLELPPGTLLSRLHRGRQKLKEILVRDPAFVAPEIESSPPKPSTP